MSDPRQKTSWVSGSATFPNGRGLIIATIIGLLTICGACAAGVVFIVRSSDAAETQAVERCQQMVIQERRASDSRYAPAGSVERLIAKVDGLSDRITELRGDVQALRQETRQANARRRR
jgi:hypothetical protein